MIKFGCQLIYSLVKKNINPIQTSLIYIPKDRFVNFNSIRSFQIRPNLWGKKLIKINKIIEEKPILLSKIAVKETKEQKGKKSKSKTSLNEIEENKSKNDKKLKSFETISIKNSNSNENKNKDLKKLKIEEILLQKEDIDQNNLKFSFENKVVTVYTDGACSSNGQNGASAGIGVYFGPNHQLNVSKKLKGKQTNNRAEITAAKTAIELAIKHNASELILYTDSKYLIQIMTVWLPKWKSNGWKTTVNKPVKNIQDLKELNELSQKIKIIWKYVPGHSGVKGNEEADMLARSAII